MITTAVVVPAVVVPGLRARGGDVCLRRVASGFCLMHRQHALINLQDTQTMQEAIASGNITTVSLARRRWQYAIRKVIDAQRSLLYRSDYPLQTPISTAGVE